MPRAPLRRVYIPKAGRPQKCRPLAIPTFHDRLAERAMLMVVEPIWGSEFYSASYGFRPERSVHRAIRAVRLQLLGNDARGATAGHWVIEGDLASYFDTVSLRPDMWSITFFRAAHEEVPQGGVISPILSNVM